MCAVKPATPVKKHDFQEKSNDSAEVTSVFWFILHRTDGATLSNPPVSHTKIVLRPRSIGEGFRSHVLRWQPRRAEGSGGDTYPCEFDTVASCTSFPRSLRASAPASRFRARFAIPRSPCAATHCLRQLIDGARTTHAGSRQRSQLRSVRRRRRVRQPPCLKPSLDIIIYYCLMEPRAAWGHN